LFDHYAAGWLNLPGEQTKILLIGQAGSGKSSFAKVLAERYKLSYVGLDALYYKAGWIKRTAEEFEIAFTERMSILSANRRGFIIEGVYIDASNPNREKFIDELIKNKGVTTILWIHEAFEVRVWRIIKRSILRKFGLEEQGASPEKWINVKALLQKQWITSSTTLTKMTRKWPEWKLYKNGNFQFSFGLFGQLYGMRRT
jgi:adenylate kinase family enzyme